MINEPEDGMGYQFREITISNNTKEEVVIFNSQAYINLRDINIINKMLLFENINKLIEDAKIDDTIVSIKKIDSAKLLEYRLTDSLNKINKKKGAVNNSVEQTKVGEYFIRYSPFENDFRVDRENNRLISGTYATTHEDSLACKDNSECIINRYALPSEKTIQWKFHVKTTSGIDIQRGIVEPNFGEKGGGIEVFFKNGTNKDSLFNSEKI